MQFSFIYGHTPSAGGGIHVYLKFVFMYFMIADRSFCLINKLKLKFI